MEGWNGFMVRKGSIGFGVLRSSIPVANNRDHNNNNDDEEEEEFEEEDVLWSAKEINQEQAGDSNATRFVTTSPRKIPTRSNEASNKRVARCNKVQQSSAPMQIPDWSKIYGSTFNASWGHDDDDGDDDDDDNDFDGDNSDDGDDMVPPHEWIAQKLSRSQNCSFSVCEGIGRTLKGRDLSKVRNTILAKTGFLE